MKIFELEVAQCICREHLVVLKWTGLAAYNPICVFFNICLKVRKMLIVVMVGVEVVVIVVATLMEELLRLLLLLQRSVCR